MAYVSLHGRTGEGWAADAGCRRRRQTDDADCFADQLQGQVKGEGAARHAVRAVSCRLWQAAKPQSSIVRLWLVITKFHLVFTQLLSLCQLIIMS